MKLVMLHYVIPAIICGAITFLIMRTHNWYDAHYNEHQSLRKIIEMINTGQIEVKKSK